MDRIEKKWHAGIRPSMDGEMAKNLRIPLFILCLIPFFFFKGLC